MLRRLLLLLAFLAGSVSAQGYVVLKRATFTSVSNDSAVRLIGSAASFHKLTWNKLGTVTVCTIKVEQSADGVGGWTDLITSQDCSVNGSTALVTAVPNFIRISTITTFTGTGSVVAVYTGYIDSPGSASTVDGVTFDLHTTPPVAGDVLCFVAGPVGQPCSLSKTFTDDLFRIADNGDVTKLLAFQGSGITTATTRTWTVPDYNLTPAAIDHANTGTAAMTLDMSASTSADAVRLPNIAAAAPTVAGVQAYDTTLQAVQVFAAGLKAPLSRGALATNCTTEGNCATQADTTGTAGNIDTASGTGGTSELIFRSKLTIPANYIVTNKMFEACAAFEFTTSASPPNGTLRLKAGATNLFVSGTGALLNSSVTSKSMSVCVPVQGTAVAGAAAAVEIGGLVGHTNPGAIELNQTAMTVAVATNAQIVLQWSYTWAANTAGNNIILRQMYVKALN